MTRLGVSLLMAFCGLLLLVMAPAVMAQGEPPAPFAGLENPFAWDDEPAQAAGSLVYRQSCLGCHGVDGGNTPVADFSRADYPAELESAPDYYYWIVTKGNLSQGMPPFESGLSETERWQVLTYIRSFGEPSGTVEAAPSPEPVVDEGSLSLTAPENLNTGDFLNAAASLKDESGVPVAGATIKLLVTVNFFVDGLMEVTEAVTDAAGSALLSYSPREVGETTLVARYHLPDERYLEARTTTTISGTSPEYVAEAGLQLPAPGVPVFIGPESAVRPGESGTAPTSAFYLPGGVLSWLLIVVVTVGLIWATYFRVISQLFYIPPVARIQDFEASHPRLAPTVGLILIALIGLMLVLMLLTGPYSHAHLLR